ncbi:MAG: glycosyltransferase family 4 protein [Anaerolineaceae bacterium]|nr:glycosyltransferase family 4 protein [Anaerolineaceae bacterium]
MTSIVFVQIISTHYTKRLFEILSKYQSIQYLFFSKGDKWYWQSNHGTQEGDFNYLYVTPNRFLGIEINFNFIRELLKSNYEIYLTGVDGKLEMPITFLISKIRGKPFIIWTGIWTRLGTRFHKTIFPILKFIYQKSDAIVVYGTHVKRYLISEGINAEKIFVANHSIDNSQYNNPVSETEILKIRNKYKIDGKSKTILYLGRLEEIKGVEFLIKALIKLNIDFLCIIAGTGNDEEKLKSLVIQLKLEEKVVFTGYIPITETRFFYAISDVYVLPSITTISGKETWGLTINEALNQSIPVIATNAVGAAAGGLVKHGWNGLIVNEQNPVALAKAIETILDPKNYESFKINAGESIKNWTQEEMSKGFLQAFDYVQRGMVKK